MKTNEINEILMLGEAKNIEFKSHCRNIETIGQVVCGFLNATGGYIICGVDDEEKIIGVDNAAEIAKILERELEEGLSPKALVSIQLQDVKEKALLIIEVPAGEDRPYAFQNVIYIREDHETRMADIDTIRDIILRKHVEPERWERRFSSADLNTDLDIN